MLNDSVRLEPGDSVLQNGANSALGRYIIQVRFIAEHSLILKIANRTGGTAILRRTTVRQYDTAYGTSGRPGRHNGTA